jgi:hypothetical protein
MARLITDKDCSCRLKTFSAEAGNMDNNFCGIVVHVVSWWL